MTEFVLRLMLDFKLNLAVSSLALMTYLFNFAILKLKTEYRCFKYQMILVLILCPYFNVLFLLFNCMLGATKAGGYRFVKIKRKKRAKSEARIQAKA